MNALTLCLSGEGKTLANRFWFHNIISRFGVFNVVSVKCSRRPLGSTAKVTDEDISASDALCPRPKRKSETLIFNLSTEKY